MHFDEIYMSGLTEREQSLYLTGYMLGEFSKAGFKVEPVVNDEGNYENRLAVWSKPGGTRPVIVEVVGLQP